MEKENEKKVEKETINKDINNDEINKENDKKEEILEKKENSVTEEKNEERKEEETEEKTEERKQEKTEENVEEKKTQDNSDKIKNKNSNVIILISLLIIFLLFISTIFAILNIDNDKIINGTYIEGINVSNLTKENAINLINEKISTIEDIELKFETYNTVIKLDELGIEINAKNALNEAINIGKSNNIIIDNYNILKTNLFKKRLKMDINIDENKFNTMINNIQVELPNAVQEYTYEIKEDELIIINGKNGISINKDIIKERIIKNIKDQFNSKNEIVEIAVENSKHKEIDIDILYKQIYKKPQDAYIVENKEDETIELYKEENGIDFNISIDDAKELLLEEKEEYSIPLKITKPKVKVKDLGDKLFKQTLAKYTTIYDAGEYNRSHNIALAAKTINGTILLPGETFSYNGILGNTNKDKGYKEGTAYVGGKVVKSYGGGICQVSSTLYNAVLYANLEIVERYNHSYSVSYVPAGRDATVAYGGKDFKFKNTRKYPIQIVSSAKNGVISISIKGLKEEMDKYEIVLTSSVLSTTPNSTTYENNSNLAEGTEKVIQKGYIGKKSIAYKIVKNPDGTTKSKTVLSKDTYKPMNRIVQVGTQKKIQAENQNVSSETQSIEKPTQQITINNNISI